MANSTTDSGGFTGMDRKRARPWRRSRAMLAAALALAALAAAGVVWRNLPAAGTITAPGGASEQVTEGPFQDYVPLRASVAPFDITYITAVSGGQVAEVSAQDGDAVTAGQALARLDNPDLTLNVASREADVSGRLGDANNQLTTLRTSQAQRDQALADAQYALHKAQEDLQKRQRLRDVGVINDANVKPYVDEAAYQAAHFVRTHTKMDGPDAGMFIPKGQPDLKYVYPRAMHIHYLLTGDERVLETDIYGGANVPPFGGYIVAANHASHLDTGLVKYALGEQGEALVALGAKDYFFDDPVRRMYFENFTNVVPMERHGSLRESLRLAGEVIRDGYILLIFPEGTRSETGVMADFKPSLGYLALQNKCGILPMYLSGTHEAMPKGRFLPKRGERVASYVGPFLSYQDVLALASDVPRSQQYRNITYHVESVIRRLAPRDAAWTLGDAGLTPKAEWLAAQGKRQGSDNDEEAQQ